MSQRLLDSASLDKPSHASRRHAVNLAATAGAFSRSSSGTTTSALVRPRAAKTIAVWIGVGVAASVTLGLLGSKLFEAGPAPRAAAPMLPASTPRAASNSPDISPEPVVLAAPPSSTAAAEEAREIEAARGAISRGDARAATVQLDDYDSSHPNGRLKPEAMALRILALKSSGKTTEARALVDAFQAKYPEHPLLQQLQTNVAR